MSGRHRKPSTSTISVAKIAFTDAVIGGNGIALAGQAGAATDGEWDRVASCESGGTGPSTPAMTEKEVSIGTSKRIAAVLVSAPLMLGLGTAMAHADAPDGKGNTSAEENSTEAPTNPNGFGAVSSQLATSLGGLGSHTSGFAPGQDEDKVGSATGRLGVGNVSSNDGNLASTPEENTGTRPGD